jgi:GT2 family glycosyltransferase
VPGCEPAAGRGTVVMTTHNRADRALRGVERLLAAPDPWPVTVVDDASTDGTGERLRRAFAEHLEQGRLNVLTSERNRGGAARTLGVRDATTELVAFADDDSWWAPGALDRAEEVFAHHPGLGLLAATVVVEPDGRPDPIVDQLADSPLPSSEPGPSVLGFLACGAVVRRRAYLSVGGFHPMFHIGGEEELLALDLRVAGWRVVHVPSVVAHHEPDHDDGGRDDREVRLSHNRLLVRWMRRPLRTAIRSTLVSTARSATDRTERRAVLATLTTLPTALRERKVLPGPLEAEVRSLETRSSA